MPVAGFIRVRCRRSAFRTALDAESWLGSGGVVPGSKLVRCGTVLYPALVAPSRPALVLRALRSICDRRWDTCTQAASGISSARERAV